MQGESSNLLLNTNLVAVSRKLISELDWVFKRLAEARFTVHLPPRGAKCVRNSFVLIIAYMYLAL